MPPRPSRRLFQSNCGWLKFGNDGTIGSCTSGRVPDATNLSVLGNERTLDAWRNSCCSSMASNTRRPLSSVVRDFSESTTLHGVSYLGKGSAARRLLWLLAILSSFAFTSFQVYSSIQLFVLRPISTSFTQRSVKELIFPAITICNYNAFFASNYEKHLVNTTTLSAEERAGRMRFAAKLSELATAAERVNLSDIPPHVRHAPMEEIADVSQRIEDMLSLEWPAPCKFAGSVCGAQNFSSIHMDRFGTCFTLNWGKRGGEPLTVKMAGAFGGLRLTLFLDQRNYERNHMNPQAGFKVLVHDQNEYPFVEELGFAVQPGTQTSCVIRRHQMESLPAPFETNCAAERRLRIMDYFGVKYSKPACIRECLLLGIVRICKCQPLQRIIGDVKVCRIGEFVECVLPFYSELDEETQLCFDDCQEPCSRVKYDTTLSYATVVSNAFTATDIPSELVIHHDQTTQKRVENMTEEGTAEFFRNEVVGLDIYYEELSEDFIAQLEAFPWLSLLGNVGGYIGLFLGMSVLTIVEFLDLAATLFQATRGRKIQNAKETNTATSEPLGETAT